MKVIEIKGGSGGSKRGLLAIIEPIFAGPHAERQCEQDARSIEEFLRQHLPPLTYQTLRKKMWREGAAKRKRAKR